jgi:hypothetical protein
MITEHDEHFVIERVYKVWTGLPDNKAERKIKEYCGTIGSAQTPTSLCYAVKCSKLKLVGCF